MRGERGVTPGPFGVKDLVSWIVGGRRYSARMTEPLHNIIDPGWAEALEPVEGQIAAMGEFLRAEIAAGRRYLPAGENVLRAFKQPFDAVRVLIVGQDPYPRSEEHTSELQSPVHLV